MDSLIASYQSAVKDDADAVREVQRLLQDALAAAAEKDRQAQDAIRGAWLGAGGVAGGRHQAAGNRGMTKGGVGWGERHGVLLCVRPRASDCAFVLRAAHRAARGLYLPNPLV